VLRRAVDGGQEALLATGDGWTVRSVLWRSGTAEVTVTAVSAELAESLAARIAGDAEDRMSADEGLVAIGFWHRLERRGACRVARTVRAPAWGDIRINYSSATAAALGRLMAVDPGDLPGQLLLLYGPPGTGKTTALRALAREWQQWCDTDCVLDPEALFADPGYLMEAALGDDDGLGDDRRRLLLLEDCDELIGADAKRASGQALSRLLNLTDGLLGQGRRGSSRSRPTRTSARCTRPWSGLAGAWHRSRSGRWLLKRRPPGSAARRTSRRRLRSPTCTHAAAAARRSRPRCLPPE
jgi:hypothetical protein